MSEARPTAPDDPLPPAACLEPAPGIDSDDPAVRAFAATAVGDATDPREKAIRLYYAVRDGIRYDPYSIVLTPRGLGAAGCLERNVGFCIPKAALYCAVLRASGIPARVGYADVKNHLATGRLRELMGSDTFVYHGFTEVWLDGAWVKATPVFNIELCERFRVHPLDFDGRSDSLLQPYNADNRRHMEYVRYHGIFAGVPAETIIAVCRRVYPRMFEGDRVVGRGDFHAEAAAEAAARI